MCEFLIQTFSQGCSELQKSFTRYTKKSFVMIICTTKEISHFASQQIVHLIQTPKYMLYLCGFIRNLLKLSKFHNCRVLFTILSFSARLLRINGSNTCSILCYNFWEMSRNLQKEEKCEIRFFIVYAMKIDVSATIISSVMMDLLDCCLKDVVA